MRLLTWMLALCLSATFGCANQKPVAAPSPTPNPIAELVSSGEAALEGQDYEKAALSFRDALDLIEEDRETAPMVQTQCTLALMEAGGYRSSRQLWSDMLHKNPKAGQEAKRMVRRAEKFMKMQAEELLNQAALDLKEGKRLKAQATAEASLQLFQEAQGSKEQIRATTEFLSSLESPKQPSRSSSQ